MESWKGSVLNALQERDRREKSQIDIISAYTRLASRTAFLEAKVSALQANRPAAVGTTAQASNRTGSQNQSSSQTNLPVSGGGGTFDPTHPAHLQLKTDLSEAQRTKASLTTENAALKAQHAQVVAAHTTCKATISQLTTERDLARNKLATREEEMQYKNKQVERLQDDIIALEMQLNVLHDQKDQLQRDYDSLVARMMKYKEREAEELINNSKYS
ncbi:autophagy-related protein 16 [Kalaharituber pfeilii]|nr:autophagy-related protein 16 [Kalaharituber pfeilii]